ncbi:SRPBCC family protein [Nocardioides ungokensis]|uniref:SRPBCC family protein n=1 Tax=Nocardioides ungokensis TaxID=1643322 RepID=UPI0015DF004A|nr:carbon monoxide dehydrogenase subunit G [Nocardioides ungokensis]
MKFTGDAVLNAPVDRVWSALLDPQVLVATIPGCERLESTGENAYAMTVTAGVAAIKGTYAGSCELSDLDPHSSLVMKLQGAGAPGTIGADVNVGFRDGGDGTTTITYDADAVVGGMVGGVGQRMLTSVSRRMAGEFFGNVDAVLSGAAPVVAPAAQAAPGAHGAAAEAPGVFVAPPKPTAVGSQDDFLKGILVGAGLVLAGVVVGGVFGRRRP